MYPPSQVPNIDIEALSGIFGSVSIACWIVVFTPQILTNFRRGSADGLSIRFLVIWSAGDIFNAFGGVLQGVLPTMIILAIYYCLVDIVLLGQFFWYEGFRFTDKIERRTTGASDSPDERSRLLNGNGNASSNSLAVPSNGELSRSPSSQRLADGANYSPATPFATEEDRSRAIKRAFTDPSPLVAAVYNIFAVIIVCAAGVLGWWLSNRTHRGHHTAHNPPSDEPTGAEALQFNVLGQVFGYICAVLYLGSRIPQLLLNYRRKSTDGISMLFFVFACVGNLTYVLSIFAYSPVCAAPQHCQPGEQKEIYLKYITVNLSWFIGSFGTLVLDMGVFIQFFLYGKGDQALSDENESAVT